MGIPGGIDVNIARYPLASHSRGDDDGSWFYRIAELGEIRRYGYVPNITFTAGQWVLMQLTIFDEQHAWVNDMIFKGQIKNHWAIYALDITGV